jgi:hypothetical protein
MIVDISLSSFSGGCDDIGDFGFDTSNKISGTYVIDFSETNGCGNYRQFSATNSDRSPNFFNGTGWHRVVLDISFIPESGLAAVSLVADFPDFSGEHYATIRTFQRSYYPVAIAKGSQEQRYDASENISLSTSGKKCLVQREQDFDGTEVPSGCYSDPMNWKFTSNVVWTQGRGIADVDGQVADATRANIDCSNSMCPQPGVFDLNNLPLRRSFWFPCKRLPACASRSDLKNATINIRFQ